MKIRIAHWQGALVECGASLAALGLYVAYRGVWWQEAMALSLVLWAFAGAVYRATLHDVEYLKSKVPTVSDDDAKWAAMLEKKQ